jgi:uncharacterized protein with PIN domain
MASVKVLSTTRVGQLTGSTDLDEDQPKWPSLVDAEQWPLLNDTGRWGAIGVDLGTTTEHEGRTYIFFGDVATKAQSGISLNADLVAWIDEPEVLRHGGHLALGWKFVLPNEPTGVQGQPDWRFCRKCGSLFWDGNDTFKGFCHRDGGPHDAIGLRFVIPAREMSAQAGQPDWRYCGKCASLFWNGSDFKGVCPKDGAPHEAIGWNFLLPYEPTGVQGQTEWRYCGKCGGFFWNGGAHKGICTGAPGGGFHLNAVLGDNGWFDPFTGTDPIGQTLSLETPNGAFSYANKVWVFAGFSDPQYSGHPRPGDPAPGCYLTSKAEPEKPGPYQKEFLFSPLIGWCPRDASRDRLESHEPLGWKFFLSHDIPEGPNHQANYRRCRKCASLFWDGDPAFKGRCHRGGNHEASDLNYVLLHSVAEDDQNQANWRRCAKCASVYWNGADDGGLCPAGGQHQATPLNLILTHPTLVEDGTHQANWRFCEKCGGLFWDGDPKIKGRCPKDGAGHVAIGFNFVLPHDINEDAQHQKEWRYCGKCGGFFWNGYEAKGVCPKDGAGHEAIGYNFVLPHDIPGDVENQAGWRYCGKCFTLFWDGDTNFKGRCPKDGAGHEAIGFTFVLPHNPGEDRLTEGGWRYCIKCHSAVWTRQEAVFSWVAPWVVQNAEHPGLPQTRYEQGLLMFGFFYSGNPGIRLAWMPLKTPAAPMLQDILYYTGNPADPWSPAVEAAVVVLPHTNTYTHLSAAWLEGPQHWILLYSNANDETGPGGYHLPAVARISTSLWDWSDEIEIFNPVAQGAYGKYMHQVGSPYHINPDIPPRQDPAKPEHDGWAYGAFLLSRFTEWDATARELGIYYLLSLSSPYQVQLMHTRLLIPDEPSAPRDALFALGKAGIDFSVLEADLRQWLSNNFTPYPALAKALLDLLEGTRLRKPVYLDVIVWNYEHGPGASSPRNIAEVDLARLKAAVVEGYNTRYGESVTDFQRLVR